MTDYSAGVVAATLPSAVTAEDYIGGGAGLITAVHAIDRAAQRLWIASSFRGRVQSG
jgi:hypothetical protein